MEEWEGKLPPSLLEKLVLGVVRKRDPRVLVGPSVGEDAAVIDFGDKVLVVHSDPITGAVRNIGWYAVHIACNDVATRGAKPRWLLPVLLVPRGRIELVERIAADV
ncbi:MAG: AIR synthase, partial [Thermoprotei archaeon]